MALKMLKYMFGQKLLDMLGIHPEDDLREANWE